MRSDVRVLFDELEPAPGPEADRLPDGPDPRSTDDLAGPIESRRILAELARKMAEQPTFDLPTQHGRRRAL